MAVRENIKTLTRPAAAPAATPAATKGPSDQVLEDLRRRIVSHDLPPGTRLREQDLAGEFGVSRARIRDAFGILEERGLIERIPNRGAIVTRLQVEHINELFEVREVLEAQMVRLATEKAPPETWDELIEVFGSAMDGTLERHDLDSYAEAIELFRQRCLEAADNEVLSNILDGLYDRIHALIRRLILVPGRAAEGRRQHQDILKAMRAGKAEKAERLKRENIRNAMAWFRDYQKYLL